MVSHNDLYRMCMNELHQKHNDNQTLDEMTVREADSIKNYWGF